MVDRAGESSAVWAFEEHEHRELAHGINRIHEVGCGVASWATPDLTRHVTEILDWVDKVFDPHVTWEESWLYPEIDARTGTPWATRSARFDHSQIRAVTTKLHADQAALKVAGHEVVAEVRCHLFSLEALLRAHIEREERFLIPILQNDSWVASPATGTPVIVAAAGGTAER